MQMFYNIFVSLMIFGLKIASLFHEKAKKGVVGRKESYAIAKSKLHNQKVIWMHAASLGEYEQGLPVLEELKKAYPHHKILVSFFSPSGYENVVKKKHIADAICYLPFDRKSSVREFVSLFQTEIFFTVKYDYWYHLLQELKKRGTKIYVISALFYPKQVFFKPYGKWFVQQLRANVDYFFHQTKISFQLAKSIGLENSIISSDTRFDRVKQIRERDNFVPLMEEFKDGKPLIIFGSSWEAEEKIAQELANRDLGVKIIIAPHDVKRDLAIGSSLLAIRYSELSVSGQRSANSDLRFANYLIIDSIGLLSKLYSYADIAVVGGGFHAVGLHNILEAATFGIPVLFGNHYQKNPEADALIAFGGAKSFSEEASAVDFLLELIENETLQKQMSEKSYQFIQNQPNATQVVMNTILQVK